MARDNYIADKLLLGFTLFMPEWCEFCYTHAQSMIKKKNGGEAPAPLRWVCCDAPGDPSHLCCPPRLPRL